MSDKIEKIDQVGSSRPQWENEEDVTSQMTLLGLVGIKTVDEFVSTESSCAGRTNKCGSFIRHNRVGLKKQMKENFKITKNK